MVAYAGALVVLKIKDQEGTYQSIGGMRTTRFVLNNQPIDATHKESGAWRELLSGAGIRYASMSGIGIFTDKDSEHLVQTDAFYATLRDYTLCFGNGDRLSGAFLISSYERAGSVDDEETYSITLESSGAVQYESKELPKPGGGLTLDGK